MKLSRRRDAVLVAAAAALPFIPALSGGFVNWDDTASLVARDEWRGLGLSQLRWAFTTGLLGHFQPLPWLSFSLDHALWGLEPFGYHLTAVLLHALNAALLYFTCLELFEAAGGPKGGRARLGAALAALLWAAHPLRVESVAWITERRDVMSGSFLLAATWAWLRHARGVPGAYVWSVAAFACAMLSKVTSAAWPFSILALELVLLKRRALAEKLPYFAIVGLVLPLAVRAQGKTLVGLERAGMIDRAYQALFSVGFYLWKTALPWGLGPFYDPAYAAERPAVAAGGALALGGTAWALLRRPPARAFAGAALAYLLLLFPMSGVVKSAWQATADRYSYAPLMGLCALAGAWAAGRPAAARGLAALVLVWGALAWRQCGSWRDTLTLWRRAETLTPGSPYVATALSIVENARGVELVNADQPAAAAEHFKRAIARKATDELWVNLAVAQRELGLKKEGDASLREALRLNPKNEDAKFLLKKPLPKRR